jgi:hypothetical protein
VVYVTTEHSPAEVLGLLSEKGLGELPPGVLNFIDAFGETVGATTPERLDTISANCEDLNSISMAIAKLQERIGRHDALLAFDSLTSPYLFNESEMFRFMRLCLAKFASEGNSVLALMDEGCGREEDLGAMMSVADGILRMEAKDHSRTLNVVKHPKVETASIDVPIESKEAQTRPPMEWDRVVLKQFLLSYFFGKTNLLRKEVGDFVNLFWPSLSHWSCMLWDPKGFPAMLYEMNKYEAASAEESLGAYPWYFGLFFKTLFTSQSIGLLPKRFSRVKDMKKISRLMLSASVRMERSGILEYLEDISKPDEHYFRVRESSDCAGLDNIGATVASHVPPELAGFCQLFERNKGEWNAIETGRSLLRVQTRLRRNRRVEAVYGERRRPG